MPKRVYRWTCRNRVALLLCVLVVFWWTAYLPLSPKPTFCVGMEDQAKPSFVLSPEHIFIPSDTIGKEHVATSFVQGISLVKIGDRAVRSNPKVSFIREPVGIGSPW
jgi:hypothetical protein